MHERPREVLDERVPTARVRRERRTPARGVGTEGRVGRGEAAVDDAGRAVVERVREREFRMCELEAVPLERERCERGRSGREGMDGRAHVVPVARQRQLLSARAAADLVCGFEQEHGATGSGEERGRGEPVGTRAHDNRVVLRGGRTGGRFRRGHGRVTVRGRRGIGAQFGLPRRKMTRPD